MPVMRGATLPKDKLDELFIGVMRICRSGFLAGTAGETNVHAVRSRCLPAVIATVPGSLQHMHGPGAPGIAVSLHFANGASGLAITSRRRCGRLDCALDLATAGELVPAPAPSGWKPSQFTGIKTVNVDFCTCPSAGSDDDQIKVHRWWPLGSNFVSVMTVEMLDVLVGHAEEDAVARARTTGAILCGVFTDIGLSEGAISSGVLTWKREGAQRPSPPRDDDGNRIGTRERLRRARETTPEAGGSNNAPGTSALPIEVSSSPPASPEVEVVRWTRVAESTAAGLEPRSLLDLAVSGREYACGRPSAQSIFFSQPLARPTVLSSKPTTCVASAAAVKEHPVLYRCGHSHCFVCIRMWLERSWRCPECLDTMHDKLFRHWGEEAHLTAAYPGWGMETKVSYSWKGLRFPKDPRHTYR
ncbi:hypothetical protein B0H14DRAFT_3464230 [Mycena olivaceomarginata]|nr:hypothetical protein B0H14DRAFT_3464230 [Mycena olivaceomarginata]